MKIELNKIKPSINPIRTSLDEEKLEELTQSIKEQGLIVPIKVRLVEGGYEIVYGNRRYEAVKRAGFTEIECVVEGITDRSQLIQALTENVIREDMSEPDIARSIKAMKEDYEITNEEVAKMLGWKESKVRDYVAMLRGEVGKIVEGSHGYLPYHYVMEARAGAQDEGLAAKVVQKAIDEGLNRNQIRKVAEAASTAETPEERKFILETPIENPMFDRIVRAKERAEIERKAEVAERHMENTQEVKQFLDSIKVFEKAIKEVMEVIDFDKFSPEAVQFTLHRLKKLSETINDLTIKLMEAKK